MSAPEPYVYSLRISPGLRELVKLYAASRELSFNAAVRELIETHPAIGQVYRQLVKRAGDIKS